MTISSPFAPPPQIFSTADGTLQGLVNGINASFTVGCLLRQAFVWRNGILMTNGLDIALGGQSIEFLGSQIPQVGDVIRVEGWI